ncbi:MAG: site-specific integrase, partial [Patescibacteria group bacterium]
MPARPHYLSSILKSFSTFVEHAIGSAQTKEVALLLMIEYLKNKRDYSRWTLGELDQFLNRKITSGRTDPASAKLVTQFVSQYPPYQTSVFLNEYLLALSEDNCSPATIRNYRSDISQFMNHIGATELDRLLQKPKVVEFLKYQLKKDLKQSSIKRKLSSITQFGLWAEKRGLVTRVAPWINQLNQTWGNGPATPSWIPANAKMTERGAKHQLTPNKISFLPLAKHLSHPQVSAKSNQDFRARLQSSLSDLSLGSAWKARNQFLPYLNLGMIILFLIGTSVFGYQQFVKEVLTPLAYPTSLTRPNRDLSFQGRLTDTAYNPITSATNMRFKLYDNLTSGAVLWDSNACLITPDQDGIFSTNLGDDCGAEITQDVFTENSNVWLEVTVVAETLTPRQAIKSVAYALNAETLQGYPASASAVENTVIIMDNSGQILLGNATPVLKSTGTSFAIEAQTLTLQTSSGTNGNISLTPDGTGRVNINSDLALDGILTAPMATFSANYADGTALVLKGGPSGTVNIMEWQLSTGAKLGVINSAG